MEYNCKYCIALTKAVVEVRTYMYHSGQGVSQDLEIGCPNLMEISKQGVQIVHLKYIYNVHVNDRLNWVFKIETGCPKDTQTPLWLIL